MSLYVRHSFDYAYGVNPAVAPARVVTGINATGSGTLIFDGKVTSSDGFQFNPFATNAPFTVGVGTNAETVFPSAVSTNADGTISVTATYANTHGIGDVALSASNGGAECANASTAVPSAPSDEILVNASITIPNAKVLTLNSLGYKLVAAPSGTQLIDLDRVTIEGVFVTAAFAGGGALSVGLKTDASVAPSSFGGGTTVAASFLTSLAANQFITGIGYSGTLVTKANGFGQPLYMVAASADFTNATNGASYLIVKVRYRVLNFV